MLEVSRRLRVVVLFVDSAALLLPGILCLVFPAQALRWWWPGVPGDLDTVLGSGPGGGGDGSGGLAAEVAATALQLVRALAVFVTGSGFLPVVAAISRTKTAIFENCVLAWVTLMWVGLLLALCLGVVDRSTTAAPVLESLMAASAVVSAANLAALMAAVYPRPRGSGTGAETGAGTGAARGAGRGQQERGAGHGGGGNALFQPLLDVAADSSRDGAAVGGVGGGAAVAFAPVLEPISGVVSGGSRVNGTINGGDVGYVDEGDGRTITRNGGNGSEPTAGDEGTGGDGSHAVDARRPAALPDAQTPAKTYSSGRLISLACPHRAWLIAGCVALLVRLPFSLAVPHFVSESVGDMQKGQWDSARWNTLLLIVAGTVDALLDFWCVYLFGGAQQKIIRGLRCGLFRAILRQEVKAEDREWGACGCVWVWCTAHACVHVCV